MDLNGDGKHDWKDDAIFHNVIDSDSNSSNNSSGGNSSRGGCSTFYVSQLGKVVIVLVIILCIAALFMGYAHVIGDLLGFGVIGFFIAQWLDS